MPLCPVLKTRPSDQPAWSSFRMSSLSPSLNSNSSSFSGTKSYNATACLDLREDCPRGRDLGFSCPGELDGCASGVADAAGLLMLSFGGFFVGLPALLLS